jgi:hypothetical protein
MGFPHATCGVPHKRTSTRQCGIRLGEATLITELKCSSRSVECETAFESVSPVFRQKKSGCVVYTPGNPAEPERIEFSVKWDILFAVHPRIYYLVLNLFLFIFM